MLEHLKSWPWEVQNREDWGVNAQILQDVPVKNFPFAVYGKYPPFAFGAVVAVAVVPTDGDDQAALAAANAMVKAVNAVYCPPSESILLLTRILMDEGGIDSNVALGLAHALVDRGCRVVPGQ